MQEWISMLAIILTAICTTRYGALRSLSTQEIFRESGEIQPVLDQQSALLMPVISSVMLTVLFFLFKWIQSVLVCIMVITSFSSTAFCLHQPIAEHSALLANRFFKTPAPSQRTVHLVICILSGSAVLLWLYSSHWLVLDFLGVCSTVSIISVVRVPSLKVSTICLIGLFFNDIFWVFYSASFFGQNVMVEVATKNAENPMQQIAEMAKMPIFRHSAPNLLLPIKLVFPGQIFGDGSQSFHMLGLGDMAIPGLFLAFALAFDVYLEEDKMGRRNSYPFKAQKNRASHSTEGPRGLQNTPPDCQIELRHVAKRTQANIEDGGLVLSSAQSVDLVEANESEPRSTKKKVRLYFHSAQFGYAVGMFCSVAASRYLNTAQPALVYLVPGVLLPIFICGIRNSHLRLLWNGFPIDDAADVDNGSHSS